ncbi:MAG: sigma-70 family RNA polymerase sigma factor, partial [Tannerellaceae bacterium]|nr:sigma-70 family RNA polymerase sigma factor [Tannerellaceae bacterium]
MLEAGNSLQAYLYRMVYNKSVNILKHRGVQEKYCAAQEEINRKRIAFYQPDKADIITLLENADLRKELYLSINDLPDQCRKIFKLSYIHNMKNKAIAELLDLSARTVEAHMYKALKILREKLQHLI